jgi:hypothetical protein
LQQALGKEPFAPVRKTFVLNYSPRPLSLQDFSGKMTRKTRIFFQTGHKTRQEA